MNCRAFIAGHGQVGRYFFHSFGTELHISNADMTTLKNVQFIDIGKEMN